MFSSTKLSGHTAFNSISLVEKLPLKIECLDIWGERLVVGTTEGVLLVYEVKEKKGETRSPFFMSLVDSHKTFSKKPIKMMQVLDSMKLLISLSDLGSQPLLGSYDYVNVHVLGSFRLHSTLTKTRGCHLFAADKNTFPPRLACAVKKRVIIYDYDGKQFNELKDFQITELPISMSWCGNSVCIGFKRGYSLMNAETGAMTEIFATEKMIPTITPIPTDQLLLGRNGGVSVFVDYEGKPTRRYGLCWSEQPLCIGYSFPYVIGILPKYVEVRTMSAGASTLVQTITLRNAKLLQIDGSSIYIASQSHIWRLLPVPILTQVDQMVKEREYEGALALMESLTDFDETLKAEKIAWIRKLLATHLFVMGQYERAMEHFAKLSNDPLEVIGLYQNFLPKPLREKYEYPMEIPVLAGTVLEKALAGLINYLVQIRPTVQQQAQSAVDEDLSVDSDYSSVSDLCTIIDTALLKAYIKTNNDDITTLVSNPNHCHIKECEKVLMNYNKFEQLVLLYRGKGLHRKALELLAKLGQGPRQGNNLHGTRSSITYMTQLGPDHINLILEFSKWVLQITPREGLAIFTDRDPSLKLPADLVLQHIRPVAPSLVVPYLEYVIMKEGETNPLFHNELIFNYLFTIQQLRDQDNSSTAVDPRSKAAPPPAGSEPGLLGQTRKKLLTFLEKSQYYTPEKIYGRLFPHAGLYEEKAIVLSRIQQHEQALSIYIYKLLNHQMAEAYCLKHYNPESEDARDVYLSLLKVYLHPAEGEQPLIEPALAILNKHYTKIDAPKALELLPDSCPIQLLAPFFENVIKDRAKNKRDKQVMHSLFKLENLQVQDSLIKARATAVKITEKRLCPVCDKRIGAAVFAHYPNGVVVHYKCCKDKNVCPVTGTVFNKPHYV